MKGQKQLAECKSELAEILESKGALESAVQHLETALDESKQEKAKMVDSKKRLAIELEDAKKQLTKKCEQLDALVKLFEYDSQPNAAGRTVSSRNASLHYASGGESAISTPTADGTVYFAIVGS